MIELCNVYKYYKTAGHKKVVLDHVSTRFERGYSYGLLGVNGAGKSTTMRLIAGTEYPDSGRIKRSVRVSWPLGFASAFNPLMSGRHNVAFAARIYGQNVNRVLDFVEDFSELGDYLDMPVKSYSSGMGARLAFGLSMAIEFDCYLVDELTSVGDARFTERCERVFAERRKKSDVIMVSHSVSTIKTFCTRGGVLIDGKLIMFANVDDAIDNYMRLNR
jgi:capsular polysaccharide transport system ATP-binding protein